MDRKFCDGRRRNIRMLGEESDRAAAERFCEAAIVNRFIARKIRPAMPDVRFDAPQQIRRAPNRTAAPFIVAIIRRVKLIVGAERQRKWISKSPGDELQIRTVRMHPVNGAARSELSFDRGQSLPTFSKWRECAREHFALGICTDDVFGRELFAD